MYNNISVAERLLSIIGWIVGVALAIIVGIALIAQTLIIPYLSELLMIIIGWCILVLAVLGVILALVTRLQSEHL